MKNLGSRKNALLSLVGACMPRTSNGLRLDMDGHLTADTRAAVQHAFNGVFARHRAVGGTVALVSRGKLLDIFSYGYAQKGPKIPVAVDTLYRVASVSKLVFTFGVMKLIEEGVLALDTDISDALGYPVRNPAFPGLPITLRQLLTHTAGLRDGPLYDGPGISGKLTLREMFSPTHAALNFAQTEPGIRFCYSNFGSGIVGSLIEAATGARFDDVLQRTLFAPLGITASYVPQRMLPYVDRLANGYAVRPFSVSRLQYDAPSLAAAPLPPMDPEHDFMGTPGRLLLCAPDAAKLLRLLCSDGAIDGVRILAPDSMREMRIPQHQRGSVCGDAGRGLNVAFCPALLGRARVMGHQGVAYGMNAELWADPDTGDGVFMVTNGALLCAFGPLVHCGWAATRLGFDVLKALS